MRTEKIQNVPAARSAVRIAFSLVLVGFSALSAFQALSDLTWLLSVGLGVLAIMTAFLRGGWAITFTIAGGVFGALSGSPKSSAPESLIRDSIMAITIGLAIGFVLGVAADMWERHGASGRQK
jgi:hypothetical protein